MKSKPKPNSIPFTPGIEKAKCEIELSKESKKGFPIPTGTPVILQEMEAPMESPSWISVGSFFSKSSFSTMVLEIPIPRSFKYCFAKVPANTKGAVKRPEK